MRELAIPVGTFLIGILSSLVATRKNKDDSNNFKLDQAIDTWQNLADNNKHSWDLCEVKYKELEVKYNEQRELILELRSRVLHLENQVRGIEKL